MKKYFLQMSKMLSLAAFVMIGLMTVVACGSDDDDNGGNGGNGGNGKLDNPEYADVAAFYEITSPDSDIKTLELTESGRYLITLRGGYKARNMKNTLHKHHFLGVAHKALTRNTTYGNVIEGKYTKKGDGTFELEGYGTVTITGSSDNALSIEVTTKDGTKLPTLTAQRKNQKPESDETTKLCRTWDLASIRMIIDMQGKNIYDKEYKMDELYKFGRDMYELNKKYFGYDLDDDESAEAYENEWKEEMKDYTNTVTFTKAGTYLVTYNDNTLAVSTWSWINEKTGLLRYSWNYDNMDDGSEAGTVKVSYRGAQLAVQEDLDDQEMESRKTRANDDDDWDDEDWDDEDYEDYFQTSMITYCDEAK